MAAYAAIVFFENERIPRNYLRYRDDAFKLSDKAFKRFFRLDKSTTIYLVEKIQPFLPDSRFPALLRLLTALRFYATGSYQSSIGNDVYINVCQRSVSRVIREVSKVISMHLMKEFIKFPNTDDLINIKRKFKERYGIPGTIGAIDCTHVRIVTPPGDNIAYINRKGNTSINVQLIVDPDLMINGICAKFPGSVHDSFIWRQSLAREHISQLTDSWLLGDSGYPLEPWLMTPFATALPGSIEESFNDAHASARACVERCNGVVKARFRCLLKDRVLHYKPHIASHIINACAVLHNICCLRNLELDEDIIEDDDDDYFPPSDDTPSNLARDIRYRLALILAQ